MTAVAAFLWALVAFLLFGIATARQYESHVGSRLPRHFARRCRRLAWTMVALSLIAAGTSWGWTFGPVAWAGLLMAGAATSFLLLNFVPTKKHVRTANRL